MRIVIDTNVFVGACLGAGASNAVVAACLRGEHMPLMGTTLMKEYEEVLARLRADPRFSGLHVIAYTAHALPEEKQRLIDAGFDDLLIKPISLKSVEIALADFLQA